MALFIIFASAIVGLLPGLAICSWLGIYGEASGAVIGLGWILTTAVGWKLAAIVGRPPTSTSGDARDFVQLEPPRPSESRSEKTVTVAPKTTAKEDSTEAIAAKNEQQRHVPRRADAALTANELDRPDSSVPSPQERQRHSEEGSVVVPIAASDQRRADENKYEHVPDLRLREMAEAEIKFNYGFVPIEVLRGDDNEHDQDGICLHCGIPPAYSDLRTSLSPGRAEAVVADPGKPHLIVDGQCRDCGHPAGRTRPRSPAKLRAEHVRGEHPPMTSRHCPECRAETKARAAEWQAIHKVPGHDCPECEESRRRDEEWAVTRTLQFAHRRGEHAELVPGCTFCDAASERLSELAAHARGEHDLDYRERNVDTPCSECVESERASELAAHAHGEHRDFDFRDKNADAPCSECRVEQWAWYESGRSSPRPAGSGRY